MTTPAATAREHDCMHPLAERDGYPIWADCPVCGKPWRSRALATAEAPGRVAALEAALRAIAVREPAPAIPGCTCDPDSATDDDGNLVMCALHEPMLRHLRWETLASLVIDYQAFMRHALAVADATLAAHAPAAGVSGEVVAFDEADDMCPNCQTPWKCNGPHFTEFTPRYQTAPAPTPSEPVER